MYPAPINIIIGAKPLTFICYETAYQAFKCPERANEFTEINGYEAKKIGKKVEIREDWEEMKVPVMQYVLGAKFTQNPQLMQKLKQITKPIVEENTWNDTFLGVCHGTGQNMLGKFLTEIRDA